MKWPILLFACAAIMCAAAGCALQNRQSIGPDLAAAAGWKWEFLSAGQFDLAVAESPLKNTGPGKNTDTLIVYIEGDGLAYLTPTEPAMDPTPRDPVALRLALAHPGGGMTAYLARPCQYVMPDRARNCREAYWTGARFAPEAVEAAGIAIDRLKARMTPGTRLILVGYSGGGALAALLAERRTDVAGLVTVAADLDLAAWTAGLGLTPLRGSLDPAIDAGALSHLPQVHFTGLEDKVVDGAVLRAFLTHLPEGAPVKTVEVAGQTHGCCWAAAWPTLSQRPELSIIPGWRNP
jgi:pimeloyl-ACP methyl ester carboxylesterase